MRCEDVLVRIDACVDGELRPLNRWRVNSHLQSCAACTAELQAAERQRKEAQEWRNVTAPDILRVRIAADLAAVPRTAVLLKADSSSRSGTALGEDGYGRQGLLRPKRVVGIAILLVQVAGIATLLFWMRWQGSKPLSYSQVRKAMQGVRTVHWTTDISFALPAGAAGGTGNVLSTGHHTSDCWARINPPAIVGNDNGTYRPLVEGGGTGWPMRDPSGRDLLSFRPQDSVFSLMFPTEMLRTLGAKPHTGGDEADSAWHGETVTQGGHTLLRFTRAQPPTPAAVEQEAPKSIALVMDETTQVLVDPNTHRIASIEYTVTMQLSGSAIPFVDGMPGPTTTVKLKDMTYDVAPPQGIFDTKQ